MRFQGTRRSVAIAIAEAVLLAMLTAAPLAAAERVAGTKVTLAPPAGFVPATEFPGFRHVDSGSSIMITEIPGPIDKLRAGLTTGGLAGRGMTMHESSELRIEQEEAQLLRVTQSAMGLAYEKWILVFGSSSDVVFIVATYPESETKVWREPMKAAVLSARRSSEAPADRFEGLSFRVTETPALRIANRISNAVLLTEGGAEGPVAPENPLLVVGASISTVDLSDLKAFSEVRLRHTEAIADLTNLAGRGVTVDGLKAWELTADAVDKESSKPLRLYQLVVADGTRYFLVQGHVGAARADEFVPQFRDLAMSLRVNK